MYAAEGIGRTDQAARLLLGSASMSVRTSATRSSEAPRDGLVRLWAPGIELRSATRDGDETPVMNGHFCIFNRWTEIDSWFEGNFMERLAKGSAKKTMKDNRDNIKVLFQHGRDMMIGSKPLGPIADLREDSEGGYYEVPLLDAPYVREQLLPGLAENLYGASFRFSVVREEWNDEPGVSSHNPKGIPERTIKEFRLSEFGPVTFPAYTDATAGLRSITDDFLLLAAGVDPEVARMAQGTGADMREFLLRMSGDHPGVPVPQRERINLRTTATDDVETEEPDETEAETPEEREAEVTTTDTADVNDSPDTDSEREGSDAVDEEPAPGQHIDPPERASDPPRPPEVPAPRYREQGKGDATPGRRSTSRLPLHTTSKESWRL